jgi:hypothetical protein
VAWAQPKNRARVILTRNFSTQIEKAYSDKTESLKKQSPIARAFFITRGFGGCFKPLSQNRDFAIVASYEKPKKLSASCRPDNYLSSMC